MTNFLLKIFKKFYRKNVNIKEQRCSYGVFCGIIGIICNLLLFLGKLMVGILASSISIIADSVNNLSDIASFVITIIGFKISSKPPDKKHPFGYGRVEYVCGLIVAFLIIIMGIEFVKSSFNEIFKPSETEISAITIALLVFSMIVKFWISRFFKVMGRKISSSAILATSRDSFNDMLVTSSILIGLIIVKISNISLDGYLGLAVSIFIIYAGFSTAKETLGPILGQAPDEEFLNLIKEKTISYEKILSISDIVVHNYGPGRAMISLYVEVSRNEELISIYDKIIEIKKDLQDFFSCEFIIGVNLSSEI
ncbi:MAG: cation diffusion facilitator family transporter [Oscillospiraceae bacterium]|jgi:cation diffusion facilitator family transporter|nr:cation diffusion facilitator family transporter [Oscillospiraceae bacterium]